MQDQYARPLSLESSLRQKRNKNINKDVLEHSKVQDDALVRVGRSKQSNDSIEELVRRLEQVFLAPDEVGIAFRFLFRIARANFSAQPDSCFFLRLALSEAYVRAEKALHDRD